ncbi:hypothetical protein AVEN_242958-1, partial [Araneus ventricosus]
MDVSLESGKSGRNPE